MNGQPEALVGEELEIEHIAKFVANVEEMLPFAWPFPQLQVDIHHTTMQGGMNRERFNEFLVQLAARLNEHEFPYLRWCTSSLQCSQTKRLHPPNDTSIFLTISQYHRTGH